MLSLASFLYIGDILPVLRTDGNSPDSIYLFIREDNVGAIVVAQCLITIIGISLELSFSNSLIIEIISPVVVFSRKMDDA